MSRPADAGAVAVVCGGSVVSAGGDGGGPPTASRFKPGRSGNPGGRPKSLPRFRKGSRDVSFSLLAEIRDRIADKDPDTRPRLPELVDALVRVAPHGGFLPTDRQAAIDSGNARLLLMALAIKDLPDAQRTALVALLGDSKA